nr:hypothetical protein [Gemmatimonadota bacterium]
STYSSVKRKTITTVDELSQLEKNIAASAAATAETLSRQLQEASDLSALARLKFDQAGCDPLDLNRALNFVEQLNQSFTYLASIEGAKWLLEHHPEHTPYHLNLGTASGPDIVSADGEVAAETFAATHPDSNDKLRKDLEKVRAIPAKHRYVFYLSPIETKRKSDDVSIIRLTHASIGVR